jgi:hypothetical protein
MTDNTCCTPVFPAFHHNPDPNGHTTTTTSITSNSDDKLKDNITPEVIQQLAPRKRGRPKGSNNKKGQFAKDARGALNEEVMNNYVDDADDLSLQRARELSRMQFAEWDRKRAKEEEYRRSEEEANEAEAEMNEEMEFKKELLGKIEMYYRYFPELEKSCPRKGKWSQKTALRDLEGELFRCDNELTLERSLMTMKKADLMLKFAFEKLMIHGFNVPAHGLAAEAEKSQVLIEKELKELAIKYKDYLDLTPETRYLMSFVQQVGEVLQRNDALMSARTTDMQGKVDMNKYADL